MEYIYAVLLLHTLGKEINEESVKKVIEATGTTVDEAKLKTVLASLKGVDIEKVLKEAALAPAQAAPAAAPAAGEAKEKKEEKEEKKEAVEGLAALFG